MRTKIPRTCINFRSEIYCQAFLRAASSPVLPMDRQGQAKPSLLMPSQNMQSMTFSRSLPTRKAQNCIWACLRFMEESAWTCSITRKSFKSLKTRITKFKSLVLSKSKPKQLLTCIRSSIMVTPCGPPIRQQPTTPLQDRTQFAA